MANGISGLPFPTFAPPQGGGGITQVKMAPSQVRFPTAGRFARRAPEPETEEIIGPLLGFGADSLLKGLGGIFGQSEAEKNVEYLKSLEDIENDDIREVQQQAYQIYGRPEDKDSFGLDEIANLVIASQLGRGGDDYIKGVLDSKKATETDRRTVANSRASFINSLLTKENPNLQSRTYIDVNKAKLGVTDIRAGAFNPDPNNPGDLIYKPDHPNASESGYVNTQDWDDGKANWVNIDKFKTDTGINVGILKDVNKEGMEQIKLLQDKESALVQSLIVGEDILSNLEPALEDPSLAPTNIVGKGSAIFNSAYTSIDGISRAVGFGSIDDFFSSEDTGGTLFAGKGDNAEALFNYINSGDDLNEEQLRVLMGNMEESTGFKLDEAA
jgi:hypothetical protein